jgi:MFS transporter, CP family, cyanate transporter
VTLRRPDLSSGGLAGPGPTGTARRGLGAALLVAGIIALAVNLRAAITSLPPLFPEMSATLHLSSASLAALAAVPVLCFGLFSGIAAPLSLRFGEERVLGSAAVLLAVGLLLRGAAPMVLLFPGTIVASGAIAMMNVLLPSLVKRRRPDQAGLLIGLYLMSLSGGAIVGSLVAVPVFTAAGGGNAAIRLALGLWALPAIVAAAAWLPQLRYRSLPQVNAGGGAGPAPGAGMPPDAERRQGAGQPPAAAAPPAAELRPAAGPLPGAGGRHGVLAMARYPLAWQVTAFMGLQSFLYYATLSWFPTMFRDRGASAAHAGDLLALMNLGNAVTAMLLPVLAHRARDQRVLVAASTAATTAGLAGAGFAPLSTAAAWVLLLGLGQGATLGLGIFLTMARAPDPATAASLSGFAQGGGYLLAATGPLLVGFLHSTTGGWAVPIGALLGITALQVSIGWLAGRNLTVPQSHGPPRRSTPESG